MQLWRWIESCNCTGWDVDMTLTVQSVPCDRRDVRRNGRAIQLPDLVRWHYLVDTSRTQQVAWGGYSSVVRYSWTAAGADGSHGCSLGDWDAVAWTTSAWDQGRDFYDGLGQRHGRLCGALRTSAGLRVSTCDVPQIAISSGVLLVTLRDLMLKALTCDAVPVPMRVM